MTRTSETDKANVFAEGNHVVLHCRQVWPDGLEYAGTDIFRPDKAGKVVTHSDVLQELPDQSKKRQRDVLAHLRNCGHLITEV